MCTDTASLLGQEIEHTNSFYPLGKYKQVITVCGRLYSVLAL